MGYTLLRILARSVADWSGTLAQIARGNFLDVASGDWLTRLAKSQYNLDRYQATFAQGTVDVSVAAGAGPYTIAPNQLWVQDAAGTRRFNSANAVAVTLPAGPSTTPIPISFQAEQPGSAYNLAFGTGIVLATPLPGVSVAMHDVGGGQWLTTQGADQETDAALRVRARSRWATIGLQKTTDAYVFLAMNTPGVVTQPNRVKINDTNPRGAGTIDIYLAGPAGPLPAADVTTIGAYITTLKSPAADVQVLSATSLAVTVAARVYYHASYANALSQAAANLTALINQTPIGGTVHLAQVIEQIMLVDGVYDAQAVTINGTAGNLTLGPNQVATANAPVWSPAPTP
ncbi:MAG: baseplate J/gp47 family protein [Mycobacteriaceae bacterium]|nr:baseplate J/gp47 family protein [Mycobacteriaceae bacterium]